MIAVILAGGSGTRFWPLSKRERPKQLIRLFGERVMIGQTVERLKALTSMDRVFVVCGEHLLEQMMEQLPELERENFLVEPAARNTAPAIAWASAHVARLFPDEVVGIFPSDHFVGSQENFAAAVQKACISARHGAIVTLGMRPDRPETGYGYIQRGEQTEELGVFAVKAFVEKPDTITALGYLQDGGYDWNAGMFFFMPQSLEAELARQLPQLHAKIQTIMASGERELGTLASVFPTLESVSIDYGIMENALSVCVVPADFAWSDVGQWAALTEVRPTDPQGNVIEANVLLHDVHDSIFYSTQGAKPIAAAGVRDLIVVDTPEAVLVVPKDRAQDVRELKRLFDEQQ